MRRPAGKRPPSHRALVDEEAAIDAWLERNTPTRCETKFVAPSQRAAAPAVIEVSTGKAQPWSRAPRQDIEQALDEIARLHRQGLSTYAIGKRLKCDHRCIEYRLKRLGLLATHGGENVG